MLVKFNKKQIKALASIYAKAESYFNELQVNKPFLYKEEDRNSTIRCFELGSYHSIMLECHGGF